MTAELFSIWTPFGPLAKAEGGEDSPRLGRIGGVISSETVDFQGERVSQEGLDWSYFRERGYFNYEHRPGPENILGYPTKIELTQNSRATAVEGNLYLERPKAREIWETAWAMKKAGDDRHLGFSIEGARVETQGRDVLKAVVMNVSITAHPVNPDGRLEVLAKSLLEKGDVGYQTTAQPDPAGSLSALVPQSIGSQPVSHTWGERGADELARLLNDRGETYLAIPELAELVMAVWPKMNRTRAVAVAMQLAESME